MLLNHSSPVLLLRSNSRIIVWKSWSFGDYVPICVTPHSLSRFYYSQPIASGLLILLPVTGHVPLQQIWSIEDGRTSVTGTLARAMIQGMALKMV
jgi:hypothetical protein